MMFVKIVCLFWSVVCLPRIVSGIAGTQPAGSVFVLSWGIAATTFIVLQWLV